MAEKLNILALDVATHCGWCTETAHGVWDFSVKRDESSGMRLIRFKSKLCEIISSEKINLVTFERTAGHHKAALIVQAELHGVLKTYCEENKIQYRAFSAGEIKSHATGKGNASKDMMVKAAQEKLGLTTNDDNEADAMWIFSLTKSMYNI
jgi:Holliday junction resolvasome RuvABC endonuclease subunit